jgi:hypothetical protein
LPSGPHCRARGGVYDWQGDSEERQLGLFFFKEADAKALIDKASATGQPSASVRRDQWPQRWLAPQNVGPSTDLRLFFPLYTHDMVARRRHDEPTQRGWRA